jgi:hypothetical protein
LQTTSACSKTRFVSDNAPACLPVCLPACLSACLSACLQMVVLWFGVEVAPSFDKPWMSTSFADYWSRRWNLTTTYMLRCEKNGQMLQMKATGAV